MAERLARLSGPEIISIDRNSPTTLFTVPPKKLYLVRSAQVVAGPTSGAAGSSLPTLLMGKTSLSAANVFFGDTVQSVPGGYATEAYPMSVPFVEGEVAVGAMADSTTPVQELDLGSDVGGGWQQSSNADQSSYSITTGAISPNLSDRFPANLFIFTANTKGTTPDTVSAIGDGYQGGLIYNTVSIVTVATSTVRASILGAYMPAYNADSGTVDVVYGGTQTGHFGHAQFYARSGLKQGGPTTSDIILQTATSTGTTGTAQSVTMTPTAGNVGFQVLVAVTNGVAGSYTPGSGGVEIADGTITISPNATATIVIYDPPVTNPSVTVSGAGTSYAVACAEIARGGYPFSLTTSGVIIE